MTFATAFLVFAGAVASLIMTAANPAFLLAFVRRYGMLLLSLGFLGLALWLVFPSSNWLLAAALSINGAACVAHGVAVTRHFRLLTGFFFSILGGFQLGLVLVAALQASA
jgi:hypothetical protein